MSDWTYDVLRSVAQPVARFGARTNVEQLTRDLATRAREMHGLGLAAPQVGLPLRVVVIRDLLAPGEYAGVVNPEILAARGQLVDDVEGCLSLRGQVWRVPRVPEVVLRWRTPDGGHMRRTFTGELARVVQHERDHLEGVLISDRGQQLAAACEHCSGSGLGGDGHDCAVCGGSGQQPILEVPAAPVEAAS